MKRSLAIFISGILIFIGLIFFSLTQRYYFSGNYVFDRFTGKTRLIRDTLEYSPTPKPSSNPSSTPWTADDVEKIIGISKDAYNEVNSKVVKGDFSKVVIAGETAYTDNPYFYKISCTVKNEDSISHRLIVKAIFYDKGNNPILTEESSLITVEPNDIESTVVSRILCTFFGHLLGGDQLF